MRISIRRGRIGCKSPEQPALLQYWSRTSCSCQRASCPPSVMKESMADTNSLLGYITVEVRLKAHSHIQTHLIRQNVQAYLREAKSVIPTCSDVQDWESVSFLKANVDRIWVAESGTSSLCSEPFSVRKPTEAVLVYLVPDLDFVDHDEAEVRVHVYKSSASVQLEEFAATTEGVLDLACCWDRTLMVLCRR